MRKKKFESHYLPLLLTLQIRQPNKKNSSSRWNTNSIRNWNPNNKIKMKKKKMKNKKKKQNDLDWTCKKFKAKPKPTSNLRERIGVREREDQNKRKRENPPSPLQTTMPSLPISKPPRCCYWSSVPAAHFDLQSMPIWETHNKNSKQTKTHI